jgi:two-component system cell cycle sensor histidine kinase/response regulator CckA
LADKKNEPDLAGEFPPTRADREVWRSLPLDSSPAQPPDSHHLSGDRFQSLIRASMDGFWVVDLDGRLLEVNDAYCAMSGRSRESLLSLRVDDLEHAEEPEQVRAHIDRLVNRGWDRFESRHRRADGGVLDVEVSAVVNHTRHEILCFIHDISARKRSEAALRRLRKAVDSSRDAVMITNRDGVITEINAGFTALYGYAAGEVVGKVTPRILKSGLLDPKAVDHFWKSLTSGRDARAEYFNRRKDGTLVPVEGSASPIFDDGGAIVGFLGIQRDISDRALEHEAHVTRTRIREIFLTEPDDAMYARVLDVVLSGLRSSVGAFGYFDVDGTWVVPAAAGVALETASAAGRAPRFSRDELAGCSVGRAVSEKRVIVSNDPSALGPVAPIAVRRQICLPILLQEDVIGGIQVADSDTPYADADVRRLVTIGEDVGPLLSARLKAERTASALRESEAHYRSLFESNPHPMWVYDLETLAFLEVNDAAVAHYGYTREEFRAMTIEDIRPTTDVPRLRALLATQVGPGLDESGVWHHRKADGTLIDVEITSHRVPFGGRTAKLVLANDITERRRAESDLRLQGAALNAAADAIMIVDRDGTIAWVNPAFSALTGYTQSEAVGRSTRDLLNSGIHDKAFFAHLWTTVLAGDVWRGEMTNRRRDGSLCTEEQTITPVKGPQGDVAFFISIKRDLTRERQLQAQLLQARKMEAVGRLAGGVAHDFNNMLGVINGYAELALAALGPSSPTRGYIQEIAAAGERSTNLVRQLLAFARRQPIAPRVFDVNAAITGMVNMLTRLIGEDITLHWNPSGGARFVMMDPAQFDQMLANLMVNARDAISGVGHVAIETGSAALDNAYCADHEGTEAGDYVRLTVSDDGCGMEPDTLARVFEPFFTTKLPGRGTGLGLATVYGVVQQNRGAIDVRSEPGRGTEFTIFLPEHEPKRALSSGVQPDREPVPGSETVLLVEDEPALLALGRRVLERLGYKVLAASGGSQAIALAADFAGDIALVVTDVVMPDMSGPHLRNQLVALRPRLKCLYMSGYTADVIAERGVLEDGVQLLQKPFSSVELASKVRAMIDNG